MRKQSLTSDFLEQSCFELSNFVGYKSSSVLIRAHALPAAGVGGGEIGENIALGANSN